MTRGGFAVLLASGGLVVANCTASGVPPSPGNIPTGSREAGAGGAREVDSGAGGTATKGPDSGAPDSGASDAAVDAGPLGYLPPLHGAAALVRVAQLVSDVPTAFVCIRSASQDAGSQWLPVDSVQPGSGLSFLQVTGYLRVPPGTLGLRMVSPDGGAGCENHVLAEGTIAGLDAGSASTIVLRGSEAAGIDVTPLVDRTRNEIGGGRFRVVHAARATGDVDFFGASGLIATDFTYAEIKPPKRAASGIVLTPPGQYGPCPTNFEVDDLGYAKEVPCGLGVSAPPPGTSSFPMVASAPFGEVRGYWQTPASIDAPGGMTLETIFLYDDASAPFGFGALVCADDPTAGEPLSACALAVVGGAASVGELRVLLPTPNGYPQIQGSWDACVKSASTNDWSTSLRLPGPYVYDHALELPLGTDWDVRLVPSGVSCSAPPSTVLDSGVALPSGQRFTISAATLLPDTNGGDGGVPYLSGVQQLPAILNATMESVQLQAPYYYSQYVYAGGTSPLYSGAVTAVVTIYANVPLQTKTPILLGNAGHAYILMSDTPPDPTVIVDCDLNLPAPGTPPPPCARYPLVPVP